MKPDPVNSKITRHTFAPNDCLESIHGNLFGLLRRRFADDAVPNRHLDVYLALLSANVLIKPPEGI